jgi:predicted DNA-binding transcriptional regulator YafY
MTRTTSPVEERRRQLRRLFTICHMLDARRQGERITRDDLAQRCDCTVKTIGRDLDLLRRAEIDIVYDRSQSTLRLGSALPFHAFDLSLGEVLSLSVALHTVDEQSQTPWAWNASAVRDKLRTALPSPLRELLDETPAVSHHDRARRHYRGAPWAILDRAIHEQCTVEMTYHTLSRGETSTRLLDPYRIFERNGYYNLAGWCHKRHKVLLFALDAIREVKPTTQTFQRHPDFDPEKYFEGSVGVIRGEPVEIEVCFHPPISLWAQRHRWPFPHQMRVEGDKVLLSGQVSGLDEIRNELLRWGSGVEVLSPQALRDAIRAEALAIAQRNGAV